MLYEEDRKKSLMFVEEKDSLKKLEIFSDITSDDIKLELLKEIPMDEKYKYIGKLKDSKNIANELNNLENDEIKRKTFSYTAKQLKGNSKQLLEILKNIDFKVKLPEKCSVLKLNNLNSLDYDTLVNIKKYVENYNDIKFRLNEKKASIIVDYSFNEMSIIISKLAELCAGINQDMNEVDKFYIIYSRLTDMITYDHEFIEYKESIERILKFDEYMRRHGEVSGLYGGLVKGKAICSGYSMIAHEAFQYVGLDSKYIVGKGKTIIDKKNNTKKVESGHAWVQVKIDGIWYNVDPTWDSALKQTNNYYQYMLLSDAEFKGSHSKFVAEEQHKCKKDFDIKKLEKWYKDFEKKYMEGIFEY